ncbi:uncharacterized protein LOC4576134 [Anopheles gambiae]|uniref:uncharacterized protein LOC4576134 n=1 Tax=Anopheles gambiae TaxID=7165 RepID=UPI002AC9E5E3|nr:uncharacterized protein LOC4576134 [Anopheles gambiae]
MNEQAMEKQYHEVAARAVLGYLYDHDMYMLAEQFCMDSPYLRADQGSFELGRIPVNVLQKPLQQVMKEFIAMQSQLLQLVNLCSTVVAFPHTDSTMVLVDHLINVLKSSGTGPVLDAVITTLPAYSAAWADSQSPPPSHPTPPPAAAGPPTALNTSGSMQDSTVSAFSVQSQLEPDLSMMPVDLSMIETVAPDPLPTSAHKRPPVSADQPVPVEQHPSPACGLAQQSNSPANRSHPHVHPHQLSKPPPVTVTLQSSHDTELLATNPPEVAPVGASDENVPPVATTTAAAGVTLTDPPRSNATPLDNPIVPGTASSRSTSSRKRTHIRILDFGTPPYKRGSPSTGGYSSSAGRRPSPPPKAVTPTVRPRPVLKLPVTEEEQATSAPPPPPPAQPPPPVQPPSPPPPPPPVQPSSPTPPPPAPSAQTEQPQPKKEIVQRRPKRPEEQQRSKRAVASKPQTETIPRSTIPTPPAKVPAVTEPVPTTSTCQPSTSSAMVPPNPPKEAPAPSSSTKSPRRGTTTTITTSQPPSQHHTKAKEVPVSVRPPSRSPPRSLLPPGSPGCPVDPLAVYPMTPRFLTRPLQPLCMLSPLLGPLDMSGVSQLKSGSHSKPTDINTPGYPITPGCATTPSPPSDSGPGVSYYEGGKPTEPPAPGAERAEVGAPGDDGEASDGEEAEQCYEPQLTLAAGSEEIRIVYQRVGTRRLGTLRERDSEYEERLASRIEIDNGQRVFQIAISPIINLFEHGTK